MVIYEYEVPGGALNLKDEAQIALFKGPVRTAL
jgi:hypothetical protein